MSALRTMGNMIAELKQNTAEGLSNSSNLTRLAGSNLAYTIQQNLIATTLSNAVIGTGVAGWGSNTATLNNLWANLLAVNGTDGKTTTIVNPLNLTLTPSPSPIASGGAQKGGQSVLVPAPVPANSVNNYLNTNSLILSLKSFADTAQALQSATTSGTNAVQQRLSNSVVDFNAAASMDQAAFSLSNAFFGCGTTPCPNYTPGSITAPVYSLIDGTVTTAMACTMPAVSGSSGVSLVGLSNTILLNTVFSPMPAPANTAGVAWLPPIIT